MNAKPALHPTDRTLHHYGLGKLVDASAESVHTHLEQCSGCRERVAELTSDSFLSRLQQGQKQPSDPNMSGSTAGPESPDASPPRPSRTPPLAETMSPGLADHPDFELLRELGRGGMGVVYLAHNRLLGRDEVLKILGREIMDRPGALDRFFREIRAVARLRHENIVAAYSAFRLGEGLVFAMEYVEGLDLSRLVKAKGALPVANACNFIHQAALGLQHAHAHGIVHRDIKPANLMLSHKGNRPLIKILDFGLSKATRESPVDGGLTHFGQLLGTPDYMAPEQTINAQSTDIRADIYSLGCTLYYLLSGGPPFQAANLGDIFLAHRSTDATLLNLLRPEVPAELAAIVDKMMAKDPNRRFQAPGEVSQALVSFFKKAETGFMSAKPEISRTGQSMTRQETAGVASAPPRRATSAAPPLLPADAPSAASPRTEPVWQSPIDVQQTQRSGDEQSRVGIRRPPWVWPLLAVGVLLLGLSVVWGLVLRVKTPNGTIELVNLPRDAEVFVDGEEVAVSWPGGGRPAVITVPTGQRRIEVKKDGIQVFGDEVAIQAGGREPLTVRLVEKGAERKDKESSSVLTKIPEPRNERPAVEVEPEFLTTRIGQIKLKRIPDGKFLMGSPAGHGYEPEHPQHEVRVTRPFYLGVYEVTQRQYQVVMGNNPSYFKGSDELPVENVSWLDAVLFCNKLSEREGRKPCYRLEGDTVTIAGGDGYRLPTEAEWEYACRAGSATRFSFGDDENALGQYAWYSANSDGRTHPVGEKRPNAFGLYDMQGNVWEWCWDWYDYFYYKQSPVLDPQGPERATRRVMRGGSRDGPQVARSACRGERDPGNRYDFLGFRVARVQSTR